MIPIMCQVDTINELLKLREVKSPEESHTARRWPHRVNEQKQYLGKGRWKFTK